MSPGTPIGPDELQVGRRPVVPADGHGGGLGRGPVARLIRTAGAFLEHDRLVLLSLLALASIARFPGLAGRGDFDGDQGHDMLTLLRFIRDGQIPLLGPPTSIGEFHHGAAYYVLLAPFAWLSGGDPVGVLAGIAAIGVAAVGVTWWLARTIGGRTAGAIAGLLLAVSPAAVEESTFIWNPNPIPFFAIVALAAAWRGRTSGRARWWVIAVGSAGMVVQLHVLGVVFLPPILALGIVDAIRASRAGDHPRVRSVLGGIGGGLVVIAILFVPLLVHELQSGFLETRHAIDYFTGPGDPVGVLDPFERFVFTSLRIIGWPLVGLVTSAPFAAILTVSMALVIGIWMMVGGQGEERVAARWLGFTVLWSAISLSVLAPSLQTVVAGLPNDHYHAFLDPVVILIVALSMRALGAGTGGQGAGAGAGAVDRAGGQGAGAVDRAGGQGAGAGTVAHGGVDRAAQVLVTLALVGLAALDVTRWPPLTQPNGGWTLARDAGVRIVANGPGAIFDVRSLPVFKSAEGIGYPIIRAGGSAEIATGLQSSRRPLLDGADVVIVCDRLFEDVMGDACGGPAETRYLARLAGTDSRAGDLLLVERFDASPRTSVSVYRHSGQ